MTTKLRFEVQGKSPLVYLTFYNDDFEKNLAEVNADDFDHIEFQLEMMKVLWVKVKRRDKRCQSF